MLKNQTCFKTSKNLSSNLVTIDIANSKKFSEMKINKKVEDSFESEIDSNSDDSNDHYKIKNRNIISESDSDKTPNSNYKNDLLLINRLSSKESNIYNNNLEFLKKLKSEESIKSTPSNSIIKINPSSEKHLANVQQVRKNLKFSEDFSKFKSTKVVTAPIINKENLNTSDLKEKIISDNITIKTQSNFSGTTQYSNFNKLAASAKEFINSPGAIKNKELNFKSQFLKNQVDSKKISSKNVTTQKNIPNISINRIETIIENKFLETSFKSIENQKNSVKVENIIINNRKTKKEKNKVNCSFFSCFAK